jgi:Helix-turn-helix domain
MTQTQSVLQYLKSGKSLTPLQALDKFGILRLSARVLDLKNQGHAIDMRMLKIGSKHVGCYKLGM